MLFLQKRKRSRRDQEFCILFPEGEGISPTWTRIRRVHGTGIKGRVPLLPGYVFFWIIEEMSAHDIMDSFLRALTEFSRIDSVLKLLRYSDVMWRLHSSDNLFAEMLVRAGGNIGLSTTYYNRGNRI